MRIGVSLQTAYSTEARTGARWIVERARAANGAGLSSLFVGDHHSTAPGVYYQNVPIVGRLLAEWGEQPAGALFLLAALVRRCCSPSRSAPWRRSPTAASSCRPRSAAGPTSSRPWACPFAGGRRASKRGSTPCAGSSPARRSTGRGSRPVTPEPLEVWIGGTADAAIDRAARLGDGWLANADGVTESVRAQAAVYLRAVRGPRADAHRGGDPPRRLRGRQRRGRRAGRGPDRGGRIPGVRSRRARRTGAWSRSPTAFVCSPRWATPTSSSASSRRSRRTRSRRSSASPRCASWSPTPEHTRANRRQLDRVCAGRRQV